MMSIGDQATILNVFQSSSVFVIDPSPVIILEFTYCVELPVSDS